MTTRTHDRGLREAGATGPGPLPLWYSGLLAAVLVAATTYGLLVDGSYRVSPGVRADLAAVLRGQDLLTLMTVPVLVWAARRAAGGSLRFHLVWLGLLLYYAYSYVMYAFAPYNDAFLLYVAALGLSGYGLPDGLFRLDMSAVAPAVAQVRGRVLGWFLIGLAVLFAALWLSMLLPAIPGHLPAGRMTYDIPSAVHVLDLAFILPLLLATGRLLLRGAAAGPVLGAVLLCKMVTLGLALLFMNLFSAGTLVTPEAALWAAIAAVSAGLLTSVMRSMTPAARPWVRPSLWC